MWYTTKEFKLKNQIKKPNKNMKAKINDLLATNELWGELLAGKINGAVGLKVAEIVQEMGYKLKTFTEQREKLITDAGGVWDKEGKNLKFKDKKEEERVNTEFEEMVNSEVELYCRQLSRADLEKINIEPAKILAILWAIEKE